MIVAEVDIEYDNGLTETLELAMGQARNALPFAGKIVAIRYLRVSKGEIIEIPFQIGDK